MRISRIYLKQVGPFEEVTIDLPPGNNPKLADTYLLTGPNGSGKSTILYLIAANIAAGVAALGPDLALVRFRNLKSIGAIEFKNGDAEYVRAIAAAREGQGIYGELRAGLTCPMTKMPLVRFGKETRGFSFFKSQTDEQSSAIEELDKKRRDTKSANSFLCEVSLEMFADEAAATYIEAVRKIFWASFSYAASRTLASSENVTLQESKWSPFARCLSFAETSNSALLAEWIANQNYKALKARSVGQDSKAVQFEQSIRAAERIISEIVDTEFRFEIGVDDNYVRARLNGSLLDLGLLPDGLKSIVSWIADLLMRLDRIPWVEDTPPMQRSFLLLLDEIDIHLHPSWQRKVLPIVQRMFPNAQIIASTHSPFVVASADDARIIKLKVENGVASLESNEASRLASSVGAILRSTFDVPERFNTATEDLFKQFHEARRELLASKSDDWSKVNTLATALAQRGEEVEVIVGNELRQLERQLGKRGA